MKRAATLSSKNQVTIPAAVRKVLGLRAGESVVFDIDVDRGGTRVTLRRSPTLDELAGSVPVPDEVRGLTWAQIRERAWDATRDESA